MRYSTKKKKKINWWIFSEIKEPLDFYGNMSTNIVLKAVSKNDVHFLRKLLFKKLFSFKVIIPYIILKKLRSQYLSFIYLLHVIKKQNIKLCICDTN